MPQEVTTRTPPPGRARRLAELVARADLDRWDWVGVVGLLALLAGLWLAIGAWLGVVIGLGVALTVFGGLLLALAVAAARQPGTGEQAGG